MKLKNLIEYNPEYKIMENTEIFKDIMALKEKEKKPKQPKEPKEPKKTNN